VRAVAGGGARGAAGGVLAAGAPSFAGGALAFASSTRALAASPRSTTGPSFSNTTATVPQPGQYSTALSPGRADLRRAPQAEHAFSKICAATRRPAGIARIAPITTMRGITFTTL
jgi:hypothetical protein